MYKRQLLFSLCLFILTAPNIHGQTNVKQITKQHIEQNITKHHLKIDDIKEWRITSDHVSSLSGVHHIYGIQQLNGLDIDQATFSLHLKKGKQVQYHNNFIPNFQSKIKSVSSTPGITATNALRNTLSELKLENNGAISISERKSQSEFVLQIRGSKTEEVPVKLMYSKKQKEEYALAWYLKIKDVENGHYWSVVIDANTGQILHKRDIVSSCGEIDHTHEKTEKYGPFLENTASRTEASSFFTTPTQSYRVFAHPIENPNDTNGARTLEVNPYNTTASPDGWHHINGTDFHITNGNNIDAYSQDNIILRPDEETLEFDYNPFNPSYTYADRAAVTNAFYWTNLCHDIFYLYGFDEAAGNFQEHNYTQDGAGGDAVIVETHHDDCGARFWPAEMDGQAPTLELGICSNTDSAFDNAVIVHEYTHGLVNRLIGGNSIGDTFYPEHMDEGWADWFGMMLTMYHTDGNLPQRLRPLGLWHEGNNGMAVLRTYDTNSDAYNFEALNTHVEPSGNENETETISEYRIGEVWGAILWDLTWLLIDDYGFDEDIYYGNGGNNIALKLVMEGMKFMPDNQPGFQKGLDALLTADDILFDGAFECHIKTAFTGRGFGDGASSVITDQHLNFIPSTTAYSCSEQDCAKTYITNADEFKTCHEIDYGSNEPWFDVKANIHLPDNYSETDLYTDLNNDNGSITLSIYDNSLGLTAVTIIEASQANIISINGSLAQIAFPIRTTDFLDIEHWFQNQYFFQVHTNLTTAIGEICQDASDIEFGIDISDCDIYTCESNEIAINAANFPACITSNTQLPFNVTGSFILRGRYKAVKIELVITNEAGEPVGPILMEENFDENSFVDIPGFPGGSQGTYSFTVNESNFNNLLEGDYTIQALFYTRLKSDHCDEAVSSQELTLSFDCDPNALCENQIFVSELPSCNELDLGNLNMEICGTYCTDNTLDGLSLEVTNLENNVSTLITGYNIPTLGHFCFDLDATAFNNIIEGTYSFEITANYTNNLGEAYNFSVPAGEFSFEDCLTSSCDQVIIPPYSQGFESGLNGWTNSPNNTTDWFVSTDFSGNIPNEGFNSPEYAHLYNTTTGEANTTFLVSPCIDLTNSETASISFYYFISEISQPGTLSLEVSANNNETWTSIWNISAGFSNAQWIQETLDLSDFILDSSTIRVRFVRTSFNGVIDTAIENININHTELQNNCPEEKLQITSTTVDCQTLVDGQPIDCLLYTSPSPRD